ncbi:MAG: transglutaminase protein, partial [Marmoricola sp.]|nr:transglutaminase protein [Marmoricola sp.]
REQARSVVGQVQAEDADVVSLEGLLVRVEQGRYGQGVTGDPGTVDDEVRAGTVRTVDTWRRTMVESLDRGRGWRGMWRRSWRSQVWPVSLLRKGQ